ncbi:hypothetical protein [Tabrizicola sp. M-4]
MINNPATLRAELERIVSLPPGPERAELVKRLADDLWGPVLLEAVTAKAR